MSQSSFQKSVLGQLGIATWQLTAPELLADLPPVDIPEPVSGNHPFAKVKTPIQNQPQRELANQDTAVQTSNELQEVSPPVESIAGILLDDLLLKADMPLIKDLQLLSDIYSIDLYWLSKSAKIQQVEYTAVVSPDPDLAKLAEVSLLASDTIEAKDKRGLWQKLSGLLNAAANHHV